MASMGTFNSIPILVNSGCYGVCDTNGTNALQVSDNKVYCSGTFMYNNSGTYGIWQVTGNDVSLGQLRQLRSSCPAKSAF